MQAIDTVGPIHRVSVAQFHRMIDAGVFTASDRIELIDGKRTLMIEGTEIRIDVGKLFST